MVSLPEDADENFSSPLRFFVKTGGILFRYL